VEPSKGVDPQDLRVAVSPAAVRVLQIQHLAIAAGAAFFAVIIAILYLHLQPASPPSPEKAAESVELLNLLSLIHGGMALTMMITGQVVFGMMTGKGRLRSLDAVGALSMARNGMIVRLAMFESAAFFGLVICLLAVLNRVVAEHPLYWLNGLSLAAMLGLVALTFPTQEGLLAFLETRLGLRR
jgi:hypothetical protein